MNGPKLTHGHWELAPWLPSLKRKPMHTEGAVMQGRLLCLVLNGVAVSALAACASHSGAVSASRQAQARSLPGTPGCFWLHNVQDWTVLDNQELIVHAPFQQDAYLVKLFQPVSDLNFRQNIGFEDVERTGQICNNSYDYLIVRGYVPPRVPIVAVHQLSLAEQASLLHTSSKSVASKSPQ